MKFIIDTFDSVPKINQIGNKAQNLLLLKKLSNTKVPYFIVLTTDAYWETLKYNGFSKPAMLGKTNFSLPPQIEKELRTSLAGRLRNKKLVIRSSTTTEDTPLLTFAGRYSSFLGIKRTDKIIEAIRLCYNSLLSKNAKIYEKLHNTPIRNKPMAIIIQELAPVSTAGVMFTADPVFGIQDKILIEFTKGLGDKVTSGRETPNFFEINKKKKNKEKFKEQLRTLAINAEKIFGNPRDIEWGHNSPTNQFYLFHSRPLIFGNLKKKLSETIMSNEKSICLGKTVSRGKTSGKLKLIKKIVDLKKVEKKDIIYPEIKISSEFISVMELAGGLLISGGTLSHFATIMREFKKPCLTDLRGIETLVEFENQRITIIAEREVGKIYRIGKSYS